MIVSPYFVSHFSLVVVAFMASLVLTPLVRLWALRVGLVDQPDAHRKIHAHATPLGGGVAVILSMFVALVATLVWPNLWERMVQQSGLDLLGLVAAIITLCVVGLIDDFKGLRARQKLLGQVVACAILMVTDTVVHNIQIFGFDVQLGILAAPFTLFWLLGAINSVNLIDGADGLATTVGIVLTSTIAAMAYLTGHELEAVIALALAGSLLGFLVFNFPPATIFLGDAGSMVIGLLAGSLAMRCALKGAATYAMIAPLAIWAVPAFDCTVAILRRKLTGRSLATTDRGHLHHCLLRRGYGNRQMLCWVAVLCLLTALGAIASLRLENEWYAVGSVLVMMAIMLLTRIFGHAEFMLVADTVRNLSASFVVPAWRQAPPVLASAHHLQGSRDWDSLWRMLLRAANELSLYAVRLNLNLPWLHESYHASWRCDDHLKNGEAWHVDLPLHALGRPIGVLHLTGRVDGEGLSLSLARLMPLLDDLEQHLNDALASERSVTDIVPTKANEPTTLVNLLSDAPLMVSDTTGEAFQLGAPPHVPVS